MVLDGYAYSLKGKRPDAESCKKRTSKLLAPSSPGYDKMGALCKNMISLEDQIKFKV
jgi:hypothetical protein